MPDRCFRMLTYAPCGTGKTNLLLYMIYQLLYYDKIFLYAKNFEQSKYQSLVRTFQPISDEAGYEVIESSNDKIIPVSGLTNDNQKLVLFDDYICEKNQKDIIDYFIRGRHENYSMMYQSQSYYKTPNNLTFARIFVCFISHATMKNHSYAVKITYQNNSMQKPLKSHFHSFILINQENSSRKMLMNQCN